MTLTVGSLFSGIEGIGLGFEQAGLAVAWQCEIDPDARAVLEARFPHTPRYTDVKEIHGRTACPDHLRLASLSSQRHQLERQGTGVDRPPTEPGRDDLGQQDTRGVRAAGRHHPDGGAGCDRCVPDVDVLVGGFPCQDISVAGRRAGLAGQRSGLFHQFMRLVAELAPRWVVIENVPGLLSSGHRPDCTGWDLPDTPEHVEDRTVCTSCDPGADMATVLGALADLGYGWAYRVLDAQYFGVAQRRRRVFIVGCARDTAGAVQVLFEPESCSGDPPPRRETGTRVAAGLTAGSATGSGVNRPGRRQEDDVNLVHARQVAVGGVGGGQDIAVGKGDLVATETVGVPEIVGQAMSAKWAKGSSGPAGDEHHNLVTAYPIQDGRVKGVGRIAFTSGASAVAAAYPLAMRGRDDGAELEMGDEGVYNALRAGDGGSSRQNLVAYSCWPETDQGADLVVKEIPPDGTHPTLTANAGQYIGDRGVFVVGEPEADPSPEPDAVAYSTKLHNTESNQAGKFYEEYAPSLQADSPPPAVAFRKAQKAHDPDDCERWEEADTIDTLSSHSTTAGSAVVGTLRSHPRPGSNTDGSMVATAMQVRRLTPLECSRLQGTPDDWLELSDADATQADARQVLHSLWRSAGTQAGEGWGSGAAAALLTPEVLLAGVYGGWVSWEVAAECASSRGALPSEDPWPEGFVQTLRVYAQYRPSPYRRESFAQLALQLGRPVSELPLEGAQARQAVLGSDVWAEASAEWSVRHAQPATQTWPTPDLSDSVKYRLLGNAVCVPVAAWVGRNLARVHHRERP